MRNLVITSEEFVFKGRLEEEAAPKTCAAFLELLPYSQRVIHSRWSGEAVWIPLGDYQLCHEGEPVGFENHTSHGSRGDLLFYPGGYSETEILFVYGSSRFASKMGQLAGNHFFTLLEGQESLEIFGKRLLWQGSRPITFRLA